MIRATLEAAESKQKISPRPAAIVSNHTAETTERAMLPSSQSMMELKRPAVISGELKERLDKLLGTVNGALTQSKEMMTSTSECRMTPPVEDGHWPQRGTIVQHTEFFS